MIFILLLFNKITLGVLLALLYKRPVSIDRLRQLRVKLISRVVKESSDFLFPGERLLIWHQYSEMLSVSLRFHCLSPDMFCTAFSHAKPPRNIHAAREVAFDPDSKNNSRRITYGIGCVWGMPSLSPLSSLDEAL